MNAVDGFIDRLAELLRSILGDGDRPARPGSPSQGPGFTDPDLRDAWEELDDYMQGGSGAGRRRSSGRREEQTRGRAARPVDESLRQDYANLEVPFGADIETVKKSYKSLMLRYHPDKHGADPEKHRIALEITKKINESFERIRSRSDGEGV